MTSLRYALYLTPPPESDLWRFGCEMIGRDAATGVFREDFAPEGYTPEMWASLTREPRRYGFHATLKAPFALRADLEVGDLIDRIAGFARKQRTFHAGELEVGLMPAGDGRAFVAVKPARRVKELCDLEDRVVRAFDSLRAPLTKAERSARNGAKLTPRQRYYLEAWGYPYVLDEFRPHFTLTNPLPDAARAAKALAWEFSLRVASPTLTIDALTLFAESEPGGDFRILHRFPLGQPHRARRASSRVSAAAFID
jgi:Protein of unknown function (DUF1045)